MKIWLSKNSEIPVREQLITQITLGIASGDLPIGERLPSTSEIARRFKVHSNTVSNAYRKLAEQEWLEFRKGSGFYVREVTPQNIENSLDKIIKDFFQIAQKQGFTLSEIKKRLKYFFEIQPPDHFLVIEDDNGFREILVEEIRSATNFKVFGTSFEDFRQNSTKTGAILTAMFDEKPKINVVLPSNENCFFIKANSAAEAMKDQQRPTENDLIAVVSGWEKFLWMAKTMLIAARIDAESLIIRSTNAKNWRKGLESASMVICDSLTARNFSNDMRLRPFQIISEDSLNDLREIIKTK
jgi:GntR family transcriptional regulator